MADLGSAVMTFGGDDRDFQRAAGRVEDSMRRVASQMTQLSSFSFSFPGLNVVARDFDAVAESTGNASKELGGFLSRAGRFGAFAVVGTGLRDMAKAANEFAAAMATGQANAGDLLEKIAFKTPFIGKFIEAGRDIRKLIDGDEAAIAKSEADVKAANEKIDLQKRLAAAIKDVRRQTEDATQALNFTIGNSKFLNDAKTIIKEGERAAEDRLGKKGALQKLLDEANVRKLELARQLDEIKKEPEFFQTTDAGEEQVRNIDRDLRITEKTKELDKAREQVAALTTQMGELNKLMTETGGRPTFTALGRLVADQIGKGFDVAAEAVKRFADNVKSTSELSSVLAKMLADASDRAQALGGNIRQFQTEQNALGVGLAKGLIDQKTFDQLMGKAFWDQATRSMQNLFEQFRPSVETAARIFESNFGGVFRKYFGALGQLPDILPGRVQAQEPFKASFVGLTDLGRQIQASAATGTDHTMDGILEAVQKSLTIEQQQLEELRKQRPAVTK